MKSKLIALIFSILPTLVFALSNIETVVLVDAHSKVQAKKYVRSSACVRLYEIKTQTTGIIDTHTEVVAQAMTLRSKSNPAKYYRIYSDKRGGKGYGLIEVGAFSLPRCIDYQSTSSALRAQGY